MCFIKAHKAINEIMLCIRPMNKQSLGPASRAFHESLAAQEKIQAGPVSCEAFTKQFITDALLLAISFGHHPPPSLWSPDITVLCFRC